MFTGRRSYSIRLRLIVLVLAIFIPALLAGLWVVSLTHQLSRDANQRRLEDTARALSMVLDLELVQRATVLRALALSRMLDGAPHIPAGTLLDFDDQARRALTGLEGWLEVRTPNRLLVNTRLQAGTLPGPGQAAATSSWVQAPAVQPLRENTQLGIHHASLVQPVLRHGRAVLNLTLTVLPHEFQRIIDQQKFDQGWVAAIVDGEGYVVARHPAGWIRPGRLAEDHVRGHLSGNRAGLIRTRSPDGQDLALYFNTSPQGWTYITGMPLRQFEGMLPEDMRDLALGALLLLTLAVLAALWVSRSIARPIHTIKQLALDMQGGRPVAARGTGITECNEVAQAMAQASRAIHGAQAEMEHRVEQAVALTRHAEERMSHSHRLEALGRLTGGVAHDFNNLLGVIGNSAHLLLRKTTDPALVAPVEVTLRAVATGARLTQHLLGFAGRQSVRPCLIPLEPFLREATELIRAVTGRHIVLTVEVDPATPTVFADPNELELALINLALNARDAITDSGHVALRTAPAEAQDCAGLAVQAQVVISVTDDGSGMSEEVLKRVFEPFFSTKGRRQATGLGLSQVYGFCHQSGGTVRVNSSPGLGTTVDMILPTRNAAAAPADAPTPALARHRPIAGTRVLLVEDNGELRAVTSALLDSFGCEVIGCASPEEALALLQRGGGIDVLLTDVRMPGPMNGVSLARHVVGFFPGLPVVLISGHRGDIDAVDEFPFVQKPCTPETLVSVLQKALAREPAGG